MAAGTYNITIEQGATFSRTVTITDSAGAAFNLTGYTPTAQLRQSPSDGTIVETFTCAAVGEATAGVISFSLTAAETAAIEVPESRAAKFNSKDYVYDLIITHSDGRVVRLLQGVATVNSRVTR